MMTPSETLRSYMDAVAIHSDPFIVECFEIDAQNPLVLTESVLEEGPLADKIKATAASLKQKYHDISADFLAKTTIKAMDLFKSKGDMDPKVQAALDRIGKVGKFAVQNRALLAVLAGMVGTIVGLSSNPAAAAQAAEKIQSNLSFEELDQIIDSLAQSGIHVDDTIADAANALPPEISAIARKAAAVIRAIEDFSYTDGLSFETDQRLFEEMTIEGNVRKIESTYESHIVVKTPDGKLVIAEMHSKSTMTDGVSHFEDSHGGVKFRLFDAFRGLSKEDAAKVTKFIQSGLSYHPSFKSTSTLDESEETAPIEKIVTEKVDDFSRLAAAVVGEDRPDGTYKIYIGPQGIRVS